MKKDLSEIYQIDGYCFQSLVSCSFMIGMNKNFGNGFNGQKDLLSEKKKTYQLTIWDSKNQLQSYLLYDRNENEQLSSKEGLIIKNGDIWTHKQKIKKAYSFQRYLLILNQQNQLTVIGQQNKILEKFCNVVDFMLFQRQRLNQNQFQSQNGKQIIFVLIGAQQKSIQNVVQLSLTKIRIIYINVSQKPQINQMEKFQQSVRLEQFQLFTKGSLIFNQTERWLHSQDKIFYLSCQANSLVQKNKPKIQIQTIDLNHLKNHAKGHQILKILCVERLAPRQFFILYLNVKNQLCSCTTQISSINENFNSKDFIVGDKIQLLTKQKKQKIQNRQLFAACIYFHQQQWQRILLICDGQRLKFYSLKQLKLIHQMLMSDLQLQNPISQSYQILCLQNSTLWILDKINLTIHKLPINKIIKTHILSPLINYTKKQNRQILLKNHQNTIKILHLRLKVMKVLQSYLKKENPLISSDFMSCLRLLNKQDSISIINDGLILVINYLISNYPKINMLQKLLGDKITLEKFQQCLINLLNKLILSKYQSHVENGLALLLRVYEYFNNNNSINKHESIKRSNIIKYYEKIASSKRITKLLQQQKRQKLWQLAYMVNVKFIKQQ